VSAVNPGHIVAVTDFSPDTLRDIAAHIEVSSRFEHFVYREAELDAVWSLTGFALRRTRDPEIHKTAARIREAAHRAHDLIGEQRCSEALTALRSAI
jgi:hypothetical protein